jgi:multisubunit Na+/H+ antiporter MnhC subunit
MGSLAILGGVLVAAAVYLLLSLSRWRRLIGIGLLGQGLAVIVMASSDGPTASRIAIALVIAAFAHFVAAASFVGPRRGDTRKNAQPNERQ